METNMNSSVKELNLMELNPDQMEMINGGWNWKKALFGGAVGAVAGGMFGGHVGGVPGAVIGAAIGGAVGATVGLAD